MSDHRLLVFPDHVMPLDKLCYAERIIDASGHEAVRCYLISYGFFDVPITFETFKQQVIQFIQDDQ